ncbi:MAG: YciI family protein, partial [Panacibacter sp.]
RDSIFKGHMQNMQRLATQNKLVLAGPFYDNDQKYEGIFVLNADNMEEAKKMLETDPAVHADLLQAELYAWYGSAALQELNDLHNKIEKIHF